MHHIIMVNIEQTNILGIYWRRLFRKAYDLSGRILYYILVCYYTLQDENVSQKERSAIYVSLVYFLAPIDLIPDFLPGGYLDDMTLFFYVINVILTADILKAKTNAKAKIEQLKN